MTDPTQSAQAEAVRRYLIEHRKLVDRVLTIARMQTGPGSPSIAALGSAMCLLFTMAQRGDMIPSAISGNGLGGLELERPDGGPPLVIASDGRVTRPAAPKADEAAGLPASEPTLKLVGGGGNGDGR